MMRFARRRARKTSFGQTAPLGDRMMPFARCIFSSTGSPGEQNMSACAPNNKARRQVRVLKTLPLVPREGTPQGVIASAARLVPRWAPS
eukprot:9691270-Alexandrium_andersonii.AAC.1